MNTDNIYDVPMYTEEDALTELGHCYRLHPGMSDREVLNFALRNINGQRQRLGEDDISMGTLEQIVKNERDELMRERSGRDDLPFSADRGG